MAQNTDQPDHALQVVDLDDAALAKWLKANAKRLADIAFDWSFWRRPDQADACALQSADRPRRP